jgi:hypothetical protein
VAANAQLAAAVAADADIIVAKTVERLAQLPDVAPHDVLEQVLAEHKGAIKARACCNGRKLGEHIHDASFSYVSFDDIVAECVPNSIVNKNDGSSFFFVIPYHESVKKLLCVDFGDGHVYRQNRLVMGVKDAPALASGLSAIICEIVTLRTAAYVTSYIDDIMAVTTTAAAAATQTVVLETMAIANVPEAVSKRASGTATTVLGRVVDTVAGVARLAGASVYGYAMHLAIVRRLLSSTAARVRAAVTTANISSLLGKLTWWAGALLRAPEATS